MMERRSKNEPYNEYLKELMGALLPGFYYVVCFFMFLLPLYYLLILFWGISVKKYMFSLLFKIKDLFVTGLNGPCVFISILICSFMIGFVFSHKTSNKPDEESLCRRLMNDYDFLKILGRSRRFVIKLFFKREIVKFLNKSKIKDEVNPSTSPDNALNCINNYIMNHYAGSGIEDLSIEKKTVEPYVTFEYKERKYETNLHYPYKGMGAYLNFKEYPILKSILDKIEGNQNHNYIDGLKTRYFDANPAAFNTKKYEAHIRYASSMWYITSFFKIMGILSGVTILLCFIIIIIGYSPLLHYSVFLRNDFSDIWFITVILSLITGSLLFINWRINIEIEYFLHKLRIQEIIACLELYEKVDKEDALK